MFESTIKRILLNNFSELKRASDCSKAISILDLKKSSIN